MALHGELSMNNEHYLRSVKGLSFAIAFIISGPAMSAEKFSVANEQIQALGIMILPSNRGHSFKHSSGPRRLAG
jgi:hypothetical protein